MTANVNSDVDTIYSDNEYTLANGLEVNIERLKVRQLLKLLKIFSGGPAQVIFDSLQTSGVESEEFRATLVSALVFAMPESENESLDFFSSLVTPKGAVERPQSKAAHAQNEKLSDELFDYMDNPEIDDLVEILTRVIKIEAPHFQALLKKVQTLMKVQEKAEVAKGKKQPNS